MEARSLMAAAGGIVWELGRRALAAVHRAGGPGSDATYETTPVAEAVVRLPEFRIVVDRNDVIIGQRIRWTRSYQPHLTRALVRHLAPGATFVDVGANIGYFTLLAAQRVGPTGRVIAVEPMPANWRLLEKSLALNGLNHVEVHRVAAMDLAGPVKMIAWQRRNSGSFHLLNDPHWRRPIYQVKGRPIDEVIAGRRVDVVKMDIEGAEGLALRGMRRTLESERPVLLVEYSPPSLSDLSKMSGSEFLRALEASGYAYQDVESYDGRFTPKAASAIDRLLAQRGSTHLDLIARPRERSG